MKYDRDIKYWVNCAFKSYLRVTCKSVTVHFELRLVPFDAIDFKPGATCLEAQE